ncbi:hypothetical protein [uncultured Tenacibaculum sp.]|uniref:hypothetical protein n=1 Tax=uncultured Tenacibaculum sp. TaxID=174713 RepID=UPI00260F0B44|nr:hypothetical protein [uncultured Tenacibaculum sp.]
MTEIVTGFLTAKNSTIYIFFLIFLGSIARFVHVIFNVNDMEGLFGYRYMSSFLNALGINVSLLCSALLIKLAANKITTDLKQSINLAANMFLYVACYFMINLFIPKKQLFGTPDFPPYYYWCSMLVLSILSGRVLILFQKAIIFSEQKLKAIVRNLFDFILGDLEDEDMIKEDKKTLYKEKRVELLKNALDNE